jgi:serine/threonine protein kinase
MLLKPPNVMLTKVGVKLLDFGLSKRESVMQAGAGQRFSLGGI